MSGKFGVVHLVKQGWRYSDSLLQFCILPGMIRLALDIGVNDLEFVESDEICDGLRFQPVVQFASEYQQAAPSLKANVREYVAFQYSSK